MKIPVLLQQSVDRSKVTGSDLEAFLCVCAVRPDPFSSIVEQHVHWYVQLFEILYKLPHRPVQA